MRLRQHGCRQSAQRGGSARQTCVTGRRSAGSVASGLEPWRLSWSTGYSAIGSSQTVANASCPRLRCRTLMFKPFLLLRELIPSAGEVLEKYFCAVAFAAFRRAGAIGGGFTVVLRTRSLHQC